MLDIRLIREKPELVQKIANQKGIDLSIDALLRVDKERRELTEIMERLRFERNKLSEKIGIFLKKGDQSSAELVKQNVKQTNAKLSLIDAKRAEVELSFQRFMLLVPNLI